MASQAEMTELRITYGALWDEAAGTFVAVIDLEPGRLPTDTDLSIMIAEKLRRWPDGDGVEVRLAGQRLGISTRRALERAAGTAGGETTTSVGDGDRASLSGESTQYRALRYTCAAAECSSEAFRSFHDARFLPSCQLHDLKMELCA
jgi:hypothetical protein